MPLHSLAPMHHAPCRCNQLSEGMSKPLPTVKRSSNASLCLESEGAVRMSEEAISLREC